MTNLKLVNLMMRSTDDHPYYGKPTKEDNISEAIILAEYCKEEFADKGRDDEAMGVPSEQWGDAIVILKSMLDDYRNNIGYE